VVAGVILVIGRLDDPRPLYNGWIHLAALAVVLSMGFFVASHSGRRVALRVQLAVLLSLLTHLLFGLALHQQYMAVHITDASQTPPTSPDRPLIVPQYVAPPWEQPRELDAFRQPVAVAPPQPQTFEPTREQLHPKHIEETPRPETTGAVPEPRSPDPIDLNQPTASVAVAMSDAIRLSGEPRPAELASLSPAEPDEAALQPQSPEARSAPNDAVASSPPATPTASSVERPAVEITPRRLPPDARPQAPAIAQAPVEPPQLSARRETASSLSDGPSPAPARPAQIADTRAQADQPSAPLAANVAEATEMQGAPRSSENNATSSAALARQDAVAPRTDVPAAVGAAPFDTGQPLSADTPSQVAGLGDRRSLQDAPRPPADVRRIGPETAPVASPQASDLAPSPNVSIVENQQAPAPSPSAGLEPGRRSPTPNVSSHLASNPPHVPIGVGRSTPPSDPLLVDPIGERLTPLESRAPSGSVQTPVVGGMAATIRGAATLPAAAFAERGRRQAELQSGGADELSARTEAAIELGLQFLAQQQRADGGWSFQFVRGDPTSAQSSLRGDIAASGLALLAFLGAGYDHLDDRYRETVSRGLEYLIVQQQPDGGLYLVEEVQSNHIIMGYGHAIAAMAMCEAFGMTGDPTLRTPAQRALDFTVAAQHSPTGGWRYVPGSAPDLSVTGWQWLTLKSGQLAGLSVDERALRRTDTFVELSRGPDDQANLFVYNPDAPNTPEQGHGRQPSTVMTAVGLLLELYSGANRDDPSIRAGADHLLENRPTTVGVPAAIGTLGNPQRDTYYWYYATQVMFHMGGRYWEAWNERLHPLLVNAQVSEGALAGSWSPLAPEPDRWGAQGGRLYVTAMNLLSLEVYYRHLPIYATNDR
jgi:hypothetical protein